MSEIAGKVKQILDQVEIARKAVADTKGLAHTGVRPHGVWVAAASVCASAVLEISALHDQNQRQEVATSMREAEIALRKLAQKKRS